MLDTAKHPQGQESNAALVHLLTKDKPHMILTEDFELEGVYSILPRDSNKDSEVEGDVSHGETRY